MIRTILRSLLHVAAFAVVVSAALPAQSGPLHFRAKSGANSKGMRDDTGGVLLRVDQETQQVIPALAASWEVDPHERWITFHLRSGVHADDVVYTIVSLMDPRQNAGPGHPFQARNWPPRITVPAAGTVSIAFDAPVRGLLQLFAQVQILSKDASAR